MPIFEYVCESCENQFEMLVGATEKPECPKCKSTKLEKLMSASVGRVAANGSLPIANACPPPEAGPCSPSCCRLP